MDSRSRKLKRVRRSVRLLSRIGLCALLIEVIAFSLTSPHLAIKDVKILGANPETNAWAGNVMRSTVGKNFFRVPVSALHSKLLRHACVREAEVHRVFPRHVVARLHLRAPFAIVRCSAGDFVIDSTLIPFRKLNRGETSRLPILQTNAGRAPVLGKPWANMYVRSAAACLEAARRRDMAVLKVVIDQGGNMCLNIQNGFQIRAGSPQDIERKLWVASRFMMSQVTSLKDLRYVDVSCPNAPAFQMKAGHSVIPAN